MRTSLAPFPEQESNQNINEFIRVAAQLCATHTCSEPGKNRCLDRIQCVCCLRALFWVVRKGNAQFAGPSIHRRPHLGREHCHASLNQVVQFPAQPEPVFAITPECQGVSFDTINATSKVADGLI